MKRFLSMILALAMLISLVPAVFADDTMTETEYSGITVKYDFTSFEGAAKDVNTKGLDYAETYGFWRHRPAGRNRDANVTTYGDLKYIKYSPGNTIVGGEKNSSGTAYDEDDYFVAYEINVPVSGLYDVTLNNITCNAYGAATQLYILPGTIEDSDIDTTLKADYALENSNYSLGEQFDFYVEGQSKVYVANSKQLISGKYFEAGEYVVVYAVIEKKGKESQNAQMNIVGITLDGDGANVENAIPMSMVTSVDNAELKVGSDVATAQMSAAVYMSNLTMVTDGIAYTSSDENIATVDETGLVTAKAYGTATVTASATIDGYTVENSEEITVNADGIEIKYDVGTASRTMKDDGFLTALTYDYTNGFYEFAGTNSTSDNGNNIKDGTEQRADNHLKSKNQNVQINNNILVALEVYIPQAGIYTMKMKNGEYKDAGTVGVYITTEDKLDLTYKAENVGTKLGEYVCDNDNVTGTFSNLVKEANEITGIEITEPGYYVLSFFATGYGSVGDFSLISGTGLDPVAMPAMIKMGVDELEVGGTTTAEAIKYLSDGNPAEGATFSAVTSSNADVVTVDEDGTVTAVGVGTATLSATVTYNETPETLTRGVTVVDIGADKTITIAVDDNGDGIAAVDSSKAVGDSYTVTAADRSSENLEFRGWVRGSAENGTWVSNENPYTFTVTTNTFLTAVYSAAATQTNPVTEYYNWNGAYLGTEKKEPTLTGYSFSKWITTNVSDILSRAVAQYDVENTEYNVTTDGDFDISVEGGKYVYDAKVTCAASGAVYWYRDGKCVDYGETYSFNVWGDTKITTSAAGSPGAKVILDKVAKTTGTTEKSYMIEYDTGDKELVEVGILFGDDFEPTVEECSEKMTSQRNSDHGQFSATSACTTARGYLIYNDNGTYRVIYAD